MTQNIVNCIKTIYILLLADASMLSVDRASALLPYLRSASTVGVTRDFRPCNSS